MIFTDAALERIRAEARRATAGGEPLMGIVTSYDPNHYAAKVVLMPEGAFPEFEGDLLESDWIPISTHWSGNGWGLFMPPSPGDQVHVKFIDGEYGNGVIDGRVYDINHLPLPVPAGEFWLVHQNGQYVKLTNDGNARLHSTNQISAGNLNDTVYQLVMQTFQSLFNDHTHNGGAKPDQQMTSAHLTAVVKAN